MKVDKKKLQAAIWQAFHHGELDQFVWNAKREDIDGNDHIGITSAADAIAKRLEEQ